MATDEESAGASADDRLRRILGLLKALREAQQELEYEIIWLANELGMSEDRIGEAHDPSISRQRVSRRYDRPKPRRRSRRPRDE